MRHLLHIPTIHELEHNVAGLYAQVGVMEYLKADPLYPELEDTSRRFWLEVTARVIHEHVAAFYSEGTWQPGAEFRKHLVTNTSARSMEIQLQRYLVHKGARVERAEGLAYGIELLLLRDVVTQGDIMPDDPAFNILERWRERYMAKRIDKTLRDGETGVSFMGQAHPFAQAVKKRAPDIEIVVYDEPAKKHYPRIKEIMDEIASHAQADVDARKR
jgi:hypothetical protein